MYFKNCMLQVERFQEVSKTIWNMKTLEKYGLVSIDVDYSGSIIVDMSIELAMGAGKFMKEPEKSSTSKFSGCTGCNCCMRESIRICQLLALQCVN